jgi:hypothetical protein
MPTILSIVSILLLWRIFWLEKMLFRARNPMIQVAEMAGKLRDLDPALFDVLRKEYCHDLSSWCVLRSYEVPAIGATHGEVYYYPSEALLNFLAAFRTAKGI